MLNDKSQLTAVSFNPVPIKSTKTPNPDHYPSTRYKFPNVYLGGRADVSKILLLKTN